MRALTFLEFFAGGGMARAGLGDGWQCLFANDFDAMKVETYKANFGAGDIRCADVATLTPADLPPGAADLAWASFPCQDLSLAGGYRGLGAERDNTLTRSGTFWPFWRLMQALQRDGRAPRAVVLENVYGSLTSRGGQDFVALAGALAGAGYRVGAVVINAARFAPQSRPRVFFIAIAPSEDLSGAPIADAPSELWHPTALRQAHAGLRGAAKRQWLWWSPPEPEPRTTTFADVIETRPSGVKWHTPAETDYLLSLMSELNRAKVAAASQSRRRVIGTIYRRTRPDANGDKRQRAEVRFDDVAGCLRTPAGGSSRQTLLVVEGKKLRSRLLSPREAARLMGLADDYILPERYNDAYHVCGDGVCAPVVRFIAAQILEPILAGAEAAKRIAAE
ncbi:MAG: DNA cytosine methyltransferase [Pseudomonadota bacterium]|nr:DNA cytosine methyltransferase [Pseudomonadota bacterium]